MVVAAAAAAAAAWAVRGVLSQRLHGAVLPAQPDGGRGRQRPPESHADQRL